MNSTEIRVARFVGIAWQLIPSAYMVLTGTVPLWARISLAVWLALWAGVMVAKGTK